MRSHSILLSSDNGSITWYERDVMRSNLEKIRRQRGFQFPLYPVNDFIMFFVVASPTIVIKTCGKNNVD